MKILKSFFIIIVFSMFISCNFQVPNKHEGNEIKNINLKIKNESSYDLSKVSWAGMEFYSIAENMLLPIGSVAKKTVESDTSGYIFFTREGDFPMQLRTKNVVTVEDSSKEFVFLDSTVVIEVGNINNVETLANIKSQAEIGVFYQNKQVSNGIVIDIGSVEKEVEKRLKFTIKNSGKGSLVLEDYDSIRILSDSIDYTIIQPEINVISSNAESNFVDFEIIFYPYNENTSEITILIESNAKNCPVFSFSLTGKGTPFTDRTVTFDSNVKNLPNPQSIKVPRKTTIEKLPEPPEYYDHSFEGWFFSEDNGVTFTEELTTETIIDKDITVYAKWKLGSFEAPDVYSVNSSVVIEYDIPNDGNLWTNATIYRTLAYEANSFPIAYIGIADDSESECLTEKIIYGDFFTSYDCEYEYYIDFSFYDTELNDWVHKTTYNSDVIEGVSTSENYLTGYSYCNYNKENGVLSFEPAIEPPLNHPSLGIGKACISISDGISIFDYFMEEFSCLDFTKLEFPFETSKIPLEIWYEPMFEKIENGVAVLSVIPCEYILDGNTSRIIVPDVYTVSFQTYGGSIVEDYVVGKNCAITTEPVTSKSGASFGGWFFDSDFQNKVVFPFIPKSNMTLHAEFVYPPDNTPFTYTRSGSTLTLNITPSKMKYFQSYKVVVMRHSSASSLPTRAIKPASILKTVTSSSSVLKIEGLTFNSGNYYSIEVYVIDKFGQSSESYYRIFQL